MRKRTRTHLQPGEFPRAEGASGFCGQYGDLELRRTSAWQSNGGPGRGHPARALPLTLEVAAPAGRVLSVTLVGVFALHAERDVESPGTIGATLHLMSEREVAAHFELVNGRHYRPTKVLARRDENIGDGCSVLTLGEMQLLGEIHRVDSLRFDVGQEVRLTGIRFKDLGSPASFVISDVLFELEETAGCPFHPQTGGVPLSELGAIVRVGDRYRFSRALSQLSDSLRTSDDLDEARGQALTFLAIVTAATLETGGSREMHRLQLDAARTLDKLSTADEIADRSLEYVEEVALSLFREQDGRSGHLIDRALAMVDRNFAKPLSDTAVAAHVGLSPSHFRFLFKQVTGQPFHKYLVALRLEKARKMLLEEDRAVSEVARAVGFSGLAHFSRAFAQRFSLSPTSARRGAAD